MESKENQLRKLSETHQIQKKQEILDISRLIISGEKPVGEIERSLTINSTLNKPVMRSIFRNENSGVGFLLVNMLVVRFIESFGFSNKLNDTQIEIITIDTLEHFSYESIEDIILFFKMARSGSFGTTGRNLDSNLIFGTWLPKYLKIKSETREEEYIKNKNSSKKDSISYDEVKKTYSENKKISNRKEFKEKCIIRINEITKDFDRQMLEDLIFQWEKDKTKNDFINLLKRKRKDIPWN